MVSKKELDVIFSNLEMIIPVNRELLDQLKSRLTNWHENQRIADIFLHMVLRIFSYCDLYSISYFLFLFRLIS